jgi:hypothetical protein
LPSGETAAHALILFRITGPKGVPKMYRIVTIAVGFAAAMTMQAQMAPAAKYAQNYGPQYGACMSSCKDMYHACMAAERARMGSEYEANVGAATAACTPYSTDCQVRCN